jgi:hypothetical protein
MRQENIPMIRYTRLYTLHQIETPADWLVLRIRIETLHYSFAPLAALPVDAAYQDDPHAATELVRQAVLPRLHTLLDTRDPFPLLGGGRTAIWPRYAAERGLPVQPPPVPVIHGPSPIGHLPARSQTSERLAQVQRALETVQTAVETASTLAALWQNWQIGRAQRHLLDTQRRLLQDAIRTQLAGQDRALDHALDPAFVRGYLADHAGDGAYGALFGDESDP